MIHVVIVVAVVCLGITWWFAVSNVPWVFSLMVPRQAFFALGTILLISAGLGIPGIMQEPRSPSMLLVVLAQGWWGTFLILLPAAAMLGKPELEELLKRVGLMLAAVTAVLVLSLYIRGDYGQAFLHFWLVLFGGGLALNLPPMVRNR